MPATTLADVFGDEIFCAHVAQFPELKIKPGRRPGSYLIGSPSEQLPDGFVQFFRRRGFVIEDATDPKKRTPQIRRVILAARGKQ